MVGEEADRALGMHDFIVSDDVMVEGSEEDKEGCDQGRSEGSKEVQGWRNSRPRQGGGWDHWRADEHGG